MSDQIETSEPSAGLSEGFEALLKRFNITAAEFGLGAFGAALLAALVLWFFGWLWGGLRILSWVSIIAGMVLGAPIANPEQFSESLRKKWPVSSFKTTYVLVLLGGLGLWLFPWPSGVGQRGVAASAKAGASELRLDDLKLAAATVAGGWEEEDFLFNDTQGWTGTAFVVAKRGGKLTMITNSHCLDLVGLARADADSDGSVEIKRYGLQVQFPSGATRTVTRIGDATTNLDIAMLEVSAEGLTEGRDYVIVKPQSVTTVKVGDRVVAVGSPLSPALAGTHTFGSVSALRDQAPTGVKCKVIQHDAAINHGNSGGPLFVQHQDRNAWVGVNTWGFDQAQGIFFSIAAEEALNAEYRWASADPSGVADLIRTFYKIPVTVVAP
jgi:S1-C subfamily serine protease